MPLTDFANLTTEKKIAWSRDLWRQARDASFVLKHASTSPTSAIQKITALTKSEKGDKAVITLVPELTGNGIAGDEQLTGNEEAANSYDFTVAVDQHRMGMKSQGRMAEQRSIVEFRKTARDLLGYRFGTVIDKMGFNLLAGISVDALPNGVHPQLSATAGANLSDLDFGGAPVAPTANRAYRTIAGGGNEDLVELGRGDENGAAVAPISYGQLVNLKAEAVTRYIKPCIHSEYGEVYYFFVSPKVMANLKLDQDFLDNVRHAMPRSKSNQLFVGTDAVMVDGVIVMSHRYVPTNVGAADNAAAAAATTGAAGIALPKFDGTQGTNNATVGSRCIFMGAQALAMADLGAPYWDESDVDDYGNQPGIGIGKLYGMQKPQYLASVDSPGTTEDFGVLTLDVAQV